MAAWSPFDLPAFEEGLGFHAERRADNAGASPQAPPGDVSIHRYIRPASASSPRPSIQAQLKDEPMSYSMSRASLPAFKLGLAALSSNLDKACEFCAAKKIDDAVILQSRLAPDMFAFVRQVQVATDLAKNGAARLVGVEPPRYEDNETTIARLKTRIEATISYLETLDPARIDASEAREIVFPLGPDAKGSMKGDDYLAQFVLPNFYFHLAIAYAILRHNGVEIGKRDFLGTISMTQVA
jgi:hypothetical protein